MPRKQKRNPRDQKIVSYVTKDEKEKLQALAQSKDKSVSDIIRELVFAWKT